MTAWREDGEAGARGQLRTSDAEREQAIDVLKAAFVQGLLSKNEFSRRVGLVIASRTFADLGALTADVPGWVTSARPPAGHAREAGRALGLYEVAYLCGGPRAGCPHRGGHHAPGRADKDLARPPPGSGHP